MERTLMAMEARLKTLQNSNGTTTYTPVPVPSPTPAPAPAPVYREQTRTGSTTVLDRTYNSGGYVPGPNDIFLGEIKFNDSNTRPVTTTTSTITTTRITNPSSIHSIYFDKNSAVVKKTEQRKVNAAADELRLYAGARAQLSGYTDRTGDASYNMSLSKQRAEAVRAKLNSLGIASDRISVYHYGEEDSSLEVSDPDARRVDILIQK